MPESTAPASPNADPPVEAPPAQPAGLVGAPLAPVAGLALAPHPDRIELEAFAGPLELLLHLAKRHEVDLHDIPIAQVADQYVAKLTDAQRDGRINIDDAADFLVLAATLIEIKARAISPSVEAESSDQDASENKSEDGSASGTADAPGAAADPPIDPRYELVRQLLAYQAYREAARKLAERAALWSRRAVARAGAPKPDASAEQAAARSFDLEDANPADLAATWERLLESVGHGPGPHQVEYDDTPISLHADDLEDRMTRDGPITLQGVFVGRRAGERVGLFLAALELVRNRRARVMQDALGGPIRLELRNDPEASEDSDAQDVKEADGSEQADEDFDPSAFDWPDEASRRRAERRVRLRAARAAGQTDADVESTDNESAHADDTADGLTDELDDIDVPDDTGRDTRP
ncbi:MAG: segregation/condensation protein A [Planctomycetota bacterium]